MALITKFASAVVVLSGTYQRIALHEAVMGTRHSELDNARKFSNGITAVLYAFNSGASTVVISGINPGSTGHVYNELGLRRLHSHMDSSILLKLRGRGANLFTADPEVAVSTGRPIGTFTATGCSSEMTKLSDLGPPIPGKRHGGDRSDEQDNFYPCPICGQMVDMRDLRQVIWHERPKHRPFIVLVD